MPSLGTVQTLNATKRIFDKLYFERGLIMPTVWFKNDGSGLAECVDDPNMAIVGDYIPDWVRVPDESPDRPGEQLKVLGHTNAVCPKCQVKTCRILQLEHNFRVAECKPGCGFVFYKVG